MSDDIQPILEGDVMKKSVSAVLAFLSFAALSAEGRSLSSDFEAETNEKPWGFSTASAVLSVSKDDVSGNATSKLSFSMENQKGGRVATKVFEPAISASSVKAVFDWLPGKINDKGGNKDENGGEVSLVDSGKKSIFTIRYTHNGKISWFVGKDSPTELSFENDSSWYTVSLEIDVKENSLKGSVTEKSTGKSETFSSSLEKTGFSGVISKMTVAGIRTSGNNITWQTYLDNIALDYQPISPDSITTVDSLPYIRVSVGENKKEKSLGLPKTVSVKLADGSSALVPVSKWKAVGKKWNTKKDGVYTFVGTIGGTADAKNTLGRSACQYVYNRLPVPESKRQNEWLDRGLVALKAENGVLVSWRLRVEEYSAAEKFDIYRNGEKINKSPIVPTNFFDKDGNPGDEYMVVPLSNKNDRAVAKALSDDYLSINVQKPLPGRTLDGQTSPYRMNDAAVGDLDGDGSYEIIVKWYPENAIDSSFSALTAPTLFDAYKLDGTPLWRIDLGLSLTSGAHYNQIVVADFDGDGKSEIFLKTGDGTKVYGVTDGKFDYSKVVSVVGNEADEGKFILKEDVNGKGHITGGPEYVSFFKGDTGKVIDTVEYAFPVGDVNSWGDNFYNRSDRWNAGMAYLDGVHPSAFLGRGYYARTAYAAYSLENGKIKELWTFDSDRLGGAGAAMGNHNLAVADVDNDGCDEIIAGSLTLDNDGKILYVMDGQMNREEGSHGDAIHIGQFYPDVEGLFVWEPREIDRVASLELHDAATGETKMRFFANKDAGRAMAANVTSKPGYEVWGTGGKKPAVGGGVYNVCDGAEKPVVDSYASAKMSYNFKLYWDGDLLHELLDGPDKAPLSISKFNEGKREMEVVKTLDGCHSNNGTKANPSLQADILGDWREEVVVPTDDDMQLRIYSTTVPTELRIYCLMQDPVYRASVAWQNNGYNQPTCLGFYLGADNASVVKDGKLPVPKINYVNK